MKSIIVTILFIFSPLIVLAQDADKIVTLIVSGQGKTQDEAKQNALRNAIEQAFGTFISSKTEILNDNLVKDEIVSVSNGNIQKFEVISELNTPNDGFIISVSATVSVSKLTSFIESKGISAEFKGNLFAFNIKQQIFNEQNEIKAIKDLFDIVQSVSMKSFDYSLKVNSPVATSSDNQNWKIGLAVSVVTNENINNISSYLYKTLQGISLVREEQLNYQNLGKKLYPLSISISDSQSDHLVFRTSNTQELIEKLFKEVTKGALNFKINNGVNEIKLNSNDLEKYSKIIFRKYLKTNNLYSFGLPAKAPSTGNSAWISYMEKLYQANRVIKQQFPFVVELEDKMFGQKREEQSWNGNNYIPFTIFIADPGLIVALNNIPAGQEIISIAIDDNKSLQELDKITEYKVSPIDKK
jgi:hypothetical protein